MRKPEYVLPKIAANLQHLQTPPLANFWLKQHDHLSEMPAAEHKKLKNNNNNSRKMLEHLLGYHMLPLKLIIHNITVSAIKSITSLPLFSHNMPNQVTMH